MTDSSGNWVGCLVSIDCGDSLGIFQGQVSSFDSKLQTVSLVKAFRNGLPSQVPEITISACDIQSLEILQQMNDLEKPDITKKITFSDSSENNEWASTCQSPVRNGETRTRTFSETRRKPRKVDGRRRWADKEDDCLNTPICSYILENDFDFEKNLALFDKQAVFDEIDAATKPDVVRLVDTNRRPQSKYRCEEHVLEQQPVVHRQIKVPAVGGREFVTDSGLIVPTISLELREKLLDSATKSGFTFERQTELIGRAASDMILQLLGGSHRLNPRNLHQTPSVVLLCGPCPQGVQAISCGRHLANHEVNVIAYVPSAMAHSSQLRQELKLFQLTSGKLVCSTDELPSGPTDIILCALDGHLRHEEQKNVWYTSAIQWASKCKAPVVTLDPPVDGVAISTKWTLVPVLPLDLDATSSSLYLCDLAIPKKIFAEVGILYKSPFGPKCVIPLHPSGGV